MRRAARWLALVLVACSLPFLALGVGAALTPLPPEVLEPQGPSSLRVTDRDGHLLREVRTSDGSRARWVSLDDCSASVAQALVSAEDRRFYGHFGVDPIALVRAAFADLRATRIVSGASTITMQLARALRPRSRSIAGKLGEMALAVRIEMALSKRRILEQYINRVSFGPNLRGIGAAARAAFDKPPRELSIAEAALLVGLLRGPSYYDLAKHAPRATARRDRILARMFRAGFIGAESLETALGEPVVLQHHAPAFGAPHFVRGLVAGPLAALQPSLKAALAGPVVAIESTLDTSLQRAAEAAAARTVSDLATRNVTAASVLVVENATGDILAYVGSPDMLDAVHGGQNDGVRALRQPGSTLKPFLYALAIEQLGWTAATVLPDIELHVETPAGDYAPRDYDERFRGPVRLREALGNSLNVPAVWAALQVGVPALLEGLRAVGFVSLDQAPDHYGPALALGDGEVTLLDLVTAYAALARGGVTRPLRVARSVRDPRGRISLLSASEPARVIPATVAAQIADILRDPAARRGSFGERSVLDFDYDVAAKTGTSKGYRDNWVVGFTPAVTVGVWVGNFDGSPMSGTSGVTGAGPLFHAVIEAAMRERPRESLAIEARAEPGSLRRVEVCALSGEAPGVACPHRIWEWLPEDAAQVLSSCRFHERVSIERRSGLRAGPACLASETRDADFERFPAEYASWARAADRPMAPLVGSPRCPPPEEGREGAGALRIANVHDGERFAIDPDQPRALQQLAVQVLAPDGVTNVRLRVDGQIIAERGAAPYGLSWPLVPGDHVLVAEASGSMPSDPIRVRVRGP